jgi:hypothetical protein
MDLRHLSVGFEQPPKLLVRHLRTQVSNKEVFHDVSPIGTCLIGGCSRAIGQEEEIERATNSAPLVVEMADVWMIQRGNGTSFALERLLEFGIGGEMSGD